MFTHKANTFFLTYSLQKTYVHMYSATMNLVMFFFCVGRNWHILKTAYQ